MKIFSCKKELCRWGINPAILHDPYVSTSCTLDEWVGYLKIGMARWRQKAEEIRAKSTAPKLSTDAAPEKSEVALPKPPVSLATDLLVQ